jgi:hypothetical protein
MLSARHSSAAPAIVIQHLILVQVGYICMQRVAYGYATKLKPKQNSVVLALLI